MPETLTEPQEHNLKAFITEFGGADNPTCLRMLSEMLDYMANNPEYIGWTAWAAGECITDRNREARGLTWTRSSLGNQHPVLQRPEADGQFRAGQRGRRWEQGVRLN